MTNLNENAVETKVIEVKAKKVDVKKAAKAELSALFADFLREKGYEVNENYADFAFTAGTLVVGMENTDIQVKLITPKAGLERYAPVVYVDENGNEIEA